MTLSNEHHIVVDNEPTDNEDEGPTVGDLDQDEPQRQTMRKPPGEGYGRPISTETCRFCLGTGVVEKRRGKVMCLACDGIGTKGGAGKGRHPITLDIIRPYRTHMEEKPLEN